MTEDIELEVIEGTNEVEINPLVKLNEVYKNNPVNIRAYAIPGTEGIWAFIDQLEEDCGVAPKTIQKLVERHKNEIDPYSQIFKSDTLTPLAHIRTLAPRGHRMFNSIGIKKVLMLLEKSEIAENARERMAHESEIVRELIEKQTTVNSELIQKMGTISETLIEISKNNLEVFKTLDKVKTETSSLDERISKIEEKMENSEIYDTESDIVIIHVAAQIGVDSSTLRKRIKKAKIPVKKIKTKNGKRLLAINKAAADYLINVVYGDPRLSKSKELTFTQAANKVGSDASTVGKVIKKIGIYQGKRLNDSNHRVSVINKSDLSLLKRAMCI